MNVDANAVIKQYRDKLDHSTYENAVQKVMIENLQKEVAELRQELEQSGEEA